LNHLTAGWADAGWNGSVLTLELKNVTNYHEIELRRGDRIGQVIFFEHESVPADRSYAARGRYNGDKSVSGIKP
jgi:dCTP deaminase